MTACISAQQIQDMAKLSRLAVDDARAAKFAQGISKILGMMDILASVDTEDVAPLTNVHDMTQRLRADVANADIDRARNQSIAPAVVDGLYVVPQVIE